MKLVESGIINRILNGYGPDLVEIEESEYLDLELEMVAAPFIILIAGLMTSLVILLFEIVFKKIFKPQKRARVVRMNFIALKKF